MNSYNGMKVDKYEWGLKYEINKSSKSRHRSQPLTDYQQKIKERREKRCFSEFINKFVPGDIILGRDWRGDDDKFYLGYTFDKKILIMPASRDSNWNVSKINMVDISYLYGERGLRTVYKNKTIRCSKTPEEIELTLKKYCGHLKHYRRKNFITQLSDVNTGLII